MKFYVIPVVLFFVLAIRKAYYDVAFYNERRRTKIGLLKYMMTFYSLGILFPILREGNTKKEKEIIRKANQTVYISYAMFVLALVIVAISLF